MPQYDPSEPPVAPAAPESDVPSSDDRATRQWSMALHFSTLLGFSLLPIAGVIAPIAIWQFKKNDYPAIDEHGKNVVNWIISVA